MNVKNESSNTIDNNEINAADLNRSIDNEDVEVVLETEINDILNESEGNGPVLTKGRNEESYRVNMNHGGLNSSINEHLSNEMENSENLPKLEEITEKIETDEHTINRVINNKNVKNFKRVKSSDKIEISDNKYRHNGKKNHPSSSKNVQIRWILGDKNGRNLKKGNNDQRENLDNKQKKKNSLYTFLKNKNNKNRKKISDDNGFIQVAKKGKPKYVDTPSNDLEIEKMQEYNELDKFKFFCCKMCLKGRWKSSLPGCDRCMIHCYVFTSQHGDGKKDKKGAWDIDFNGNHNMGGYRGDNKNMNVNVNHDTERVSNAEDVAVQVKNENAEIQIEQDADEVPVQVISTANVDQVDAESSQNTRARRNVKNNSNRNSSNRRIILQNPRSTTRPNRQVTENIYTHSNDLPPHHTDHHSLPPINAQYQRNLEQQYWVYQNDLYYHPQMSQSYYQPHYCQLGYVDPANHNVRAQFMHRYHNAQYGNYFIPRQATEYIHSNRQMPAVNAMPHHAHDRNVQPMEYSQPLQSELRVEDNVAPNSNPPPINKYYQQKFEKIQTEMNPNLPLQLGRGSKRNMYFVNKNLLYLDKLYYLYHEGAPMYDHHDKTMLENKKDNNPILVNGQAYYTSDGRYKYDFDDKNLLMIETFTGKDLIEEWNINSKYMIEDDIIITKEHLNIALELSNQPNEFDSLPDRYKELDNYINKET
ncbi:hypothetical protein A3Q56_04032 [Intoshia linei]|uniref:Uncharacterized protein n=1 Tax=Intoshia linei TaxID=1819745 RepID=A0A177B3B1_9BILA|nr:hypothetical protein A3Q56_04032 [Intoshia linei]